MLSGHLADQGSHVRALVVVARRCGGGLGVRGSPGPGSLGLRGLLLRCFCLGRFRLGCLGGRLLRRGLFVGGLSLLAGRLCGRCLDRGLLLGRCLLLLLGRRRRVAGTNERELGADLDGLVLLDHDLQQSAGDRRGDLGVDLVGGYLEQGLVDRDVVADLLEPAGHRAFGDGLPERGQRDEGTPTVAACGLLLGGRSFLGWRLFLLRLRSLVPRRQLAGLLDDLLLLLGLLLRLLLVLGLRLRLGSGVGVARALALLTYDSQHGADLDRGVLLGPDLQQGAGDRRGDLGVDLVGGDLEQRLVDRHGVADLLEPAGDGAFGDRFTEGGESDFGGHGGFLRSRGVWGWAACGGQECACRGLPASARCASPRASFWVGWAWSNGATSSAWASQL